MRPLPPEDWDSSLQHIIEAMNGQPIQIHCLLANHPTLLQAWWSYRMHSVRGGDLEQRDCELVILRVAVHMRAWYEWAAHVDRGLAAGLSLEEIKRVAKGPSAKSWSEKDRLLLTAVDQLIGKNGIASDTRTELGGYFSDNQILDIISLQGMYVTIACILGTWPIEIEAHILERLPAEITEASFTALLSAAHRH